MDSDFPPSEEGLHSRKATRPPEGLEEGLRRHVEALQSPNAWTRRSAALAFAQVRTVPEWMLRTVARGLLRTLADHDPRTRDASARALGHLAGPLIDETGGRLIGAIDDPNPYVRASSIQSLGLLKCEAAREPLLRCLDDTNPRIVAAAIGALGRIGPPSVATALERFLESRQPHVLAAAALAMGALRHEAAGPRLLANLEELVVGQDDRHVSESSGRQLWAFHLPRCHIHALVQVGYRPAVPLLIEAARSHVGLRSSATSALAELDPKAAAPVLAWMLRDPSSKLRQSLLQLLDRADFPDVLPYVRPLLHDSSSENRRLALVMVARWMDRASLDEVRRMAHAEPNPYTRPLAVTGLIRLAGDDAAGDLLSLADDPNAGVRKAVAEGLARLSEPGAAAIASLRRLAVDSDDAVSEAARAALAKRPELASSVEMSTIPESPLGLLVPVEIWPEVPRLRELLASWQATLGNGSGECPPEVVAGLDRALTRLIQALDDSQVATREPR